jgi:hypothetical protein
LPSSNFPLNRQDGRDSESGRPTSLETHLVLEICRGRTEHPLRPVQSPRFLIGSSSRCDLRVGGTELPPLFALIFVEGADIWIESIAPAPPLRVNGRVETSVRIADGDRITIGPIELVAHVPAESHATIPADESIELGLEEEADAPAASELSARELVERIEAATDMVNEFEERQRLGIEALQNAIESRGKRPAVQDSEASASPLLPITAAVRQPEARPLVDLETLVVQLSGVVAELEKRSGAETRREAEYLDAVSTLFETQDRLSRQLEILLRRVAHLNADRPASREQGRAIA